MAELAVLLPLLTAPLILACGRRRAVSELLTALSVTLCLGLLLALIPVVQMGPLMRAYPLPLVGYSLSFRVDTLGLVFAVLMSFVWLLAGVFCRAYMAHGHAHARFYAAWVFTLGACVGVVSAGDFFTLFLFFEFMTFSSYVLVVHEQNSDSMKAGDLYIRLGLAGGLVLLFAVFLMHYYLGHSSIRPLLPEIAASTMNQGLVIALFLVGFGVKAGMVPLHIWLPRAHPVAPAPASALLSGIMIKVGAYGILRVLLEVFSAPGAAPDGSKHVFFAGSASAFGYGLIWIGVVTMFVGAFMALQQSMVKKTLAYSSVSQMGYILLAVGCAAFLGSNGAMGFVGAVYHVINHALFKAGLFIMVGAIYIHTHELDINRIGGLGRRFPLIMSCFVVAACGIAGVPGFNGYVSKTLIHHSLSKAYHYSHLPSLYWAEKIFVLTSALTICYFIKIFRGLFLGPLPARYADQAFPQRLSARAIPVVFAACILGIGVFPQLLYRGVVQPAMTGFAFDPANINHYIVGLRFFTWPDIRAMLLVFALTAVLYPVGNRLGLFQLLSPPGKETRRVRAGFLVVAERGRFRLPSWLSVEGMLYRPVVLLGRRGCLFIHTYLDAGVDYALFTGTSTIFRRIVRVVGSLESLLLLFYEGGTDIPGRVSRSAERRAPRRSNLWSNRNINTAALLVAFLIALFLVVFFLFRRSSVPV